MFNIGSSVPEIKGVLNSNSNHPKSAPIKNDPEISGDQHNYGGHVYKMHQTEDAYNHKKLQQTAYFLELTKQIQEKNLKCSKIPQELETIRERPAKPTETARIPIGIHPEIGKEPEIHYSRYQKKYEIENHTKIGVGTSQVLGGVLQRDDEYLNKMKKIQQQREMKEILSLQMQEKSRLREEEKSKLLSSELQELRQSMESKPDDSIKTTPSKFSEKSQVLDENDYKNYSKSTTVPLSNITQKNDEKNYETLTEFYRQLTKETEDLNSLYSEKDKQIRELEKNIVEKKEKGKESRNGILGKKDNKEINSGCLQSKAETRGKMRCDQSSEAFSERKKVVGEAVQNSRHSSVNEVMTRKQQNSKSRLSAIDEKLENARRRRMDNLKNSIPAKVVKNSEFSIKRDQFVKAKSTKEKKLASPVPQTPETELETVPTLRINEKDRNNLDTAGRSYFIYPDSQGNFKFEDEIDKFVVDYQRISSPLVRFNPSLGNALTSSGFDPKLSLSAMTFTASRAAKPLVALRPGVLNDIFRTPNYSNNF